MERKAGMPHTQGGPPNSVILFVSITYLESLLVSDLLMDLSILHVFGVHVELLKMIRLLKRITY
jgi:hypothetical protein